MTYFVRFSRLIFGLFLFALGAFLTIQADIGLAPWEAFNIGVSGATGLTYGDVVLLSGLVILIFDYALKEKIGMGTILNALLIGKFVDIIAYFDIIPIAPGFMSGIAMLLAGQLVLCVGSYYYIGAGLGCGPRDALMVALGKRLPRVPIGAIRGAIEASVLLIGFLLGAKVGIGTIISVFGIGFILQWVFRLFRFNVRGLQHESFLDTARAIRQGRTADAARR